jgi:glycine hydroxymethyltransferase
LLLVDLRNRGLTGKAADAALGKAGIHVNKNAVPNDPQPPFVTSGIRIGTPAVTTRGMREAEMRIIAGWIDTVLSRPDDEATLRAVGAQVRELAAAFPLYAEAAASR